MLRLVFVAVSVGLADSITPSTVGPALFLATARDAMLRVSQFTAAIFAVNLFAGLILTIGPGRLIVDLVPNPRGTARHVIEVVAGMTILAAAIGLWFGRRRLAARPLPGRKASARSAVTLGASVALVELPTAAAYFAVIAAVAAADVSIPEQVILLALYNAAFVAPLLAIIALLAGGGERADPWLKRGGDWLQRRWPVVLAVILLLVGSGLVVVGGLGIVR